MEAVSGSAAWASTATSRMAQTLTSRPRGRAPIVKACLVACSIRVVKHWMGGDQKRGSAGFL
uniref:Uncharacterized protein n=1 Tax=Arundo donax TaxID=35708 RepID=A0A0A9E7W0_ARUDO